MLDKDYLLYAKEIILTVLRMSSNQIDKMKEIDDISGVEILKEKVVIPYAKIYGSLLEMKVEEFAPTEYENFSKLIEDIREKNNLSVEDIIFYKEQREKFKNKSGAEVVKKFFQYNLNRALDKKSILVEKYKPLLEKEVELENLLKDTIQEVDLIDIILQQEELRKKIKIVEEKLTIILDNIDDLKGKLESEWPYEIYGILKESDLLETYKEVFNVKE